MAAKLLADISAFFSAAGGANVVSSGGKRMEAAKIEREVSSRIVSAFAAGATHGVQPGTAVVVRVVITAVFIAAQCRRWLC